MITELPKKLNTMVDIMTIHETIEKNPAYFAIESHYIYPKWSYLEMLTEPILS